MIRKYLLAFTLLLLFVVRETNTSSNGLHLPLNLEFSSSGSPLSISFSQNTEAVVLGEPLTIRCHVNTRSKEAELITRSSMNLFCPLLNKTTFCFQNCQAATVCRENGGASCQRVLGLGDVACRIVRREDQHSGGKSTQTIRLHQRRRFHATDSMPPVSATTTSTTTTTASPTVAVVSTTGLVASGTGVRRNPAHPNTEKSQLVEYLEGSKSSCC
ncbi:unnamed protein product [Dibothriocephalus latus]|uniref:ZP domain-containing protein n=1 Tax=Dibothriocephalus latus TaxID=60516 RepID=A0A3P6TJ71_DIBLA|nr:unnamed protein product [Dibothriocephalus latus]